MSDALRIILRARSTMSQDDFSKFMTAAPDAFPRAAVEIALTAYHHHSTVMIAIENDMTLTHVATIDRRQVMPLVFHTAVPEAFWSGLHNLFFNNADLADRTYTPANELLLRAVSAHFDGVHPIELEESVAYVARNLVWKGVRGKPRSAEVKNEVANILSRREALADDSLFAKQVVLVSHGEVYDNSSHKTSTVGTPRFGVVGFVEDIQNTQAALFGKTDFLRIAATRQVDGVLSASSPELAEKAKAETLAHLRDGSTPATFFFDGHGNGGGFYFWNYPVTADGQIDPNDSVYISTEEITTALADRWTNQIAAHPQDTELNVSLVFGSCFAQDYIRRIALSLSMSGIPLPHIMIGDTEYGQLGASSLGDRDGSRFNRSLIANPLLGDFIRRKHDPDAEESKDTTGRRAIEWYEPTISSPSIFIPRQEDKTKLMQLGGAVIPSASATA